MYRGNVFGIAALLPALAVCGRDPSNVKLILTYRLYALCGGVTK